MLTKNTLEVSKKKNKENFFFKYSAKFIMGNSQALLDFRIVLDVLHMSEVMYIFVLSHIDRV